MCGITGFSNFNFSYLNNKPFWSDILIKMRKKIAHRGSDTVGEFLSEHVGLGHTRLTIRDLKTGAQPITRTFNGIDYSIVYNGEIYNTDELKNDLISLGYSFKTTTDTEVILYGYIHYKEDFIQKLNGIFSFAIWDGYKNSLLLCRDRLGIKPLFYTLQNNTLIFGSEIKALFEYPDIIPKADEDTLREILGLFPARSEGSGVFKNIKEVKPGHFITFSKELFYEAEYWSLKSKPHTNDYNTTVDYTSFLVKDSIKRQLVSDVPVCTFLSGGIDSSIVTAVSSNCLKESSTELNTFSFDFTENDKYFVSNSFQPERDRPYVDKMLDLYKTKHTYLECNETDLADFLYDAVDAKDLNGIKNYF